MAEHQIIDQRGATIQVGGHTTIQTGGGTYIAGNLETEGGDFSGRDQANRAQA